MQALLAEKLRQFRSLAWKECAAKAKRVTYEGIISYRAPSIRDLNLIRQSPDLSEKKKLLGFVDIAFEEFELIVPSFKGLPILFNHQDNEGYGGRPEWADLLWGDSTTIERLPMGLVTKAWMDRYGTVFVHFRPFDNAIGHALVWLVENGMHGLSLQHVHNTMAPMAREISLCKVGKRKATAITKIIMSEFDLEPLDLSKCVGYYHPPPLPLDVAYSLYCSLLSGMAEESKKVTTDAAIAVEATAKATEQEERKLIGVVAARYSGELRNIRSTLKTPALVNEVTELIKMQPANRSAYHSDLTKAVVEEMATLAAADPSKLHLAQLVTEMSHQLSNGDNEIESLHQEMAKKRLEEAAAFDVMMQNLDDCAVKLNGEQPPPVKCTAAEGLSGFVAKYGRPVAAMRASLYAVSSPAAAAVAAAAAAANQKQAVPAATTTETKAAASGGQLTTPSSSLFKSGTFPSLKRNYDSMTANANSTTISGWGSK